MFRKLVSALPFQPSLASEVSLYLSHFKKEVRIRRVGLVFIAIGLMLQLFIFINPAQSTLTTHKTDIVYGSNTKEDLLNAYKRGKDQIGRDDIREIYNYYGIGEAQIRNAKESSIKDNNENLIGVSRGAPIEGLVFKPIIGAINGGVYEFPLSSWRDNAFPNSYPALSGLSSYGFRFWIIKNSGNIVYAKGANQPKIEILEKRLSGSQIYIGDKFQYDVLFRNTGGIAASNTVIASSIPSGLKLISYESNLDLVYNNRPEAPAWAIDNDGGNLSSDNRWYYIRLNTIAIKATDRTCAKGKISSANFTIASDSSTQPCVEVLQPTNPTQLLDTNPDNTSGGLRLELSSKDLSWDERRISVSSNSNDAEMFERVEYYIDDSLIESKICNSTTDCSIKHTFPTSGNYKIKAIAYDADGFATNFQPNGVVETITEPSYKDVIIQTDVSVENLSQNYSDANNTTARPGDKLLYNLFIQNMGYSTADKLALDNNLSNDVSDILEYAEISNLYDGILNEETGRLAWGVISLAPGQSVVKQFEITIKNPLPNTPISSSNPLSYNSVITNSYGRTVVVYLDGSPIKNIERTIGKLPNLDASISLVLVVILFIIAGIFYLRSHLLSKELKVIHRDFTSGGM